MESSEKHNEKLKYTKPELRVIELEADEVMGVGCKTPTQTASGLSNPPCIANNCLLLGS